MIRTTCVIYEQKKNTGVIHNKTVKVKRFARFANDVGIKFQMNICIYLVRLRDIFKDDLNKCEYMTSASSFLASKKAPNVENARQ